MRRTHQLGALFFAAVALSSHLLAQAPAAQPAADKSNPWEYSLTVDGYIVPNGTSYASPIFTADNNWHFEARYNDEDLYTGSLWFGYNFNFGKKKKLKVDLTPMLGGVMGRTTGIAPGLETTLTYKKIEFYAASEYVFDTTKSSGSFFYSWPQLTYSPVKWFHIGAVAQHTDAYHTSLNIQRGFLLGVSYKKLEFTTYVFDPELANPTTVLEVGYNF
ncbi:MAG: hypothetical protein WAL85_14635 [Candidatus Korobacteraceae bacterium]